MGLSKSIMTRYPAIKGLVAGTTSQTGNVENLIPEQKQKAYYSCNIIDNSNDILLLLETNDFILLENNNFIEVE